ncbi:flippase activity-associated protein Agl23 [Dictyobacter arantiisoli]|uniref:Glycosyltransferase RgtA/B/C/D-like domain-containing protein n=1 Tax=Dictyobacter arantiisoli TaxID=2014874 RepID=A0A5A5TA90_9CHLR|nr:flippase activity-associated protein Agl23 [Dictyobacter arantiisoli]GCF08267.1 hypothetical protein KDI_18310 [Dictyobacter arantiisoli]
MKKNSSTKYVVDVIHVEPFVSNVQENEQRRSSYLRLSAREQCRLWLPFVSIVLLGALVRFLGLGDKPLHHDESLHAYFSLQLMHNMEQWKSCFDQEITCYHYDPLLHGPFQFHMIALIYKISQLLGVPTHGVNTTTVRIAAATLGSAIVGLPYFLRDYLGGRRNAMVACCLLAVSPSMVYFSRFAREDIYMACFTLLLVVAAGRYIRDRKGCWFVSGSVAFVLSYATKEATFLSIAVFGSFLVALMAWEIGCKIPVRAQMHPQSTLRRYAPELAAPLTLLALLIICAPVAKWFFGWMKETSIYITNNTAVADAFIKNLKEQTVTLLPCLGLLIGIFLLTRWGWERWYKKSVSRQRTLTKHIDPRIQPVLHTLLTMPWAHGFAGLLLGSFIFTLLFSVLFTNFHTGIGDGIWQGLYYWLQQQQVARGSQPWYYYCLLIPFYEQIGLIFGIIGIVRSLQQPTRFRLFLVYWFLGTVGIYSWAGEKMPWLMIHMVMPMLLLAAIGLEPVLDGIVMLIKNWLIRTENDKNKVQSGKEKKVPAMAIFGAIAAFLLLIITLQNMFQVTYVHYADGPHEMMVYVQTTPDVHKVMSKIDLLDQEHYQGRHKLTIGIMSDASWPFYWYLRDYTNVCYGFPTGCANATPDVIVSAGSNTGNVPVAVNTSRHTNSDTSKPIHYLYHHYALRSWWDEGYKPHPCVPTATDTCQGKPTWGGVGPLLWLSYGDNPPPDARFNPLLAAGNVWNWWWQRKPIGGIGGATDMGFFIRSDWGVNP